MCQVASGQVFHCFVVRFSDLVAAFDPQREAILLDNVRRHQKYGDVGVSRTQILLADHGCVHHAHTLVGLYTLLRVADGLDAQARWSAIPGSQSLKVGGADHSEVSARGVL